MSNNIWNSYSKHIYISIKKKNRFMIDSVVGPKRISSLDAININVKIENPFDSSFLENNNNNNKWFDQKKTINEVE